MGLSMYIGLCCLGILITNPFLGAKAALCPRNWLQKLGNCYGFFDQGLSWRNAELACQRYGPRCHLASIHSPDESFLVSEYIKDQHQSSKHVWIGLGDISRKRRWRWTDGSTYNYKFWEEWQPDNYKQNEYCVELLNYSGFTQWNDDVCENLYSYLCKYKL